MTERVDVAVVGAGVTGLAAAWAAERQGAAVRLIEADSQCGGVIKSRNVGGFLIESGATSMAGSASLMEVLRDLSLQPEILQPPSESKRRFIVRSGKVRALPSSPLGFVTTSALSLRGKLRALAEPWVSHTTLPPERESVAQLVRRRFGQEVLDYVVDPFVSGVYAGDPERLSSRFALRALSEMERADGSVVKGLVKRAREQRAKVARQRKAHRDDKPVGEESNAREHVAPPPILTFRNGMQQLPRSIERALSQPVRYNERVTGVAYHDGQWLITSRAPDGTKLLASSTLVLALPAHQLGMVTWPDELARELAVAQSVVHAPVATVALAFRRDQVANALDGFGLLVPHKERRGILGALYNSTMFAGRAPADHVLLTCFVGGARFSGSLTQDDAEHAALQELTTLLGISGSPVVTSTQVWHDGIPQCNLGAEAVGAALTRVERDWPGLFFAGAYRSGVAVAECLGSGLSVGAQAAARRHAWAANDDRILAQAGLHSL